MKNVMIKIIMLVITGLFLASCYNSKGSDSGKSEATRPVEGGSVSTPSVSPPSVLTR